MGPWGRVFEQLIVAHTFKFSPFMEPKFYYHVYKNSPQFGWKGDKWMMNWKGYVSLQLFIYFNSFVQRTVTITPGFVVHNPWISLQESYCNRTDSNHVYSYYNISPIGLSLPLVTNLLFPLTSHPIQILEQIWKEAIVVRWCPNFRLEWLRKATNNFIQDSLSPGKDLNPGPAVYEAAVLTTRPLTFGFTSIWPQMHPDLTSKRWNTCPYI
jgi:hypothetical protein